MGREFCTGRGRPANGQAFLRRTKMAIIGGMDFIGAKKDGVMATGPNTSRGGWNRSSRNRNHKSWRAGRARRRWAWGDKWRVMRESAPRQLRSPAVSEFAMLLPISSAALFSR